VIMHVMTGRRLDGSTTICKQTRHKVSSQKDGIGIEWHFRGKRTARTKASARAHVSYRYASGVGYGVDQVQ
jgi:hypothetical protein